MCHFLKPLKLTQELSQKMSYSSELRYGSCFYDVYSGTAKKKRQNRRNRRKPPSFLAELDIFETFEAILIFFAPFLRSSLINIIKATAIPKLTAVTHLLAEFLR